ncbi:carbohydrate kinase family protein [Granulosicoccus antarcticus]|uniref:2-dehydro-3-deoxygluconokinase n=1 Tax=Granulosicoccus antarcticus IMCC3135 TaxID=1192854 RepID=A0A2Z2NVJ0_9GAMM|nr:carbohydrate kinase family protein [Granulosicoccus antarcticus]ASJ75486.1 2-dehydro-3-deoxygluconokinase [Granulosicoccus antarcticus IMCC3135]
MSNTGVLSAGRIYCDLNFSGIERMPVLGQEVFADELSLHAGGGAFITAAYVAALGRASVLMGTLPVQPFASIIEHEAVQRGVGLHYCSMPTQAAPQLTVAMSMAGERAFLTSRQGAALPDNHADILQSSIGGSGIRHLHIGELSTLLEYPQLVELAQAAGLSVSLDCAWDDACLEHSHIGELIAQVDIFLPNEIEMEQLRANGIDEYCAALTVVKQGAAGATAHVKGRSVTGSAEPVPVVDTIGAGDAFNAGFITAWLQKRDLVACLSLGNACGALAVTRRGGASDLPDLQYLL